MVQGSIKETTERLAEATRLVVLTGAGVSTDSGIPDFRGPNGLWTKNPLAEMASTYSHYMSSKEHRVASWAAWNDDRLREAAPNDAHRAIRDIVAHFEEGSACIVTQNIDGLHHKAAAEIDGMDTHEDRENIFEIHGHIRTATCSYCDQKFWPHQLEEDWAEAGVDDIICLYCKDLKGEPGIIKLDVIYFEELLPQDIWNKAENATWKADVVLVCGSSLTVYPVGNIPYIARQMGAHVIIVNQGETSFDKEADIKIDGPVSKVLPMIAKGLRDG